MIAPALRDVLSGPSSRRDSRGAHCNRWHGSIARTLTCLALCLAASAHARTVFTNDRHRGLDRVSQTFDRAGDANPDHDATRAFVAQCIDVIPFTGYCACLSRTLPAGLSFQQYDAVLGRSKAQNGYASLEPDVQKTYDAIPAARDRGAASAGAP